MLPVDIYPNRALEEEQSLKERVPGHFFFLLPKKFQEHFHLQNIATIIVKSIGKVAFFTSFFPCPRSNVEQNVNVCACNCSVSLNRGDGGYLATEKTLFFEDQIGLLLSCTTFPTTCYSKIPSQPFCLWRFLTQDWNFLVYVVRLDASCQVPALSKSRVFFLNISWFGMNVMYLILSVEGETYNESLSWLKIARTAAVLVLYTVCVTEQVQGQHDWIVVTGYSCHFMDQEKVSKQKRNNQKHDHCLSILLNKLGQ